MINKYVAYNKRKVEKNYKNIMKFSKYFFLIVAITFCITSIAIAGPQKPDIIPNDLRIMVESNMLYASIGNIGQNSTPYGVEYLNKITQIAGGGVINEFILRASGTAPGVTYGAYFPNIMSACIYHESFTLNFDADFQGQIDEANENNNTMELFYSCPQLPDFFINRFEISRENDYIKFDWKIKNQGNSTAQNSFITIRNGCGETLREIQTPKLEVNGEYSAITYVPVSEACANNPDGFFSGEVDTYHLVDELVESNNSIYSFTHLCN